MFCDLSAPKFITPCKSSHPQQHRQSNAARITGWKKRWTNLLPPRHHRLPLPTRKQQHLIHRVHLVANVPADRNLHRHELAVQARVQDLAELAEGADLGRQAREVDHLVFGGLSGHGGVFAEEGGGGGEEAVGGCERFGGEGSGELGERTGEGACVGHWEMVGGGYGLEYDVYIALELMINASYSYSYVGNVMTYLSRMSSGLQGSA